VTRLFRVLPTSRHEGRHGRRRHRAARTRCADRWRRRPLHPRHAGHALRSTGSETAPSPMIRLEAEPAVSAKRRMRNRHEPFMRRAPRSKPDVRRRSGRQRSTTARSFEFNQFIFVISMGLKCSIGDSGSRKCTLLRHLQRFRERHRKYSERQRACGNCKPTWAIAQKTLLKVCLILAKPNANST
jgi:hypothetical protein